MLALVLAWVVAAGTSVSSADEGEPAERVDAIRPEGGVGLRAPACELTALSDTAPQDAVEPVAFTRTFEGRVVLVDFWASWCPTCEHSFGFLNELSRDFRDDGLEVVAVNLDADPRDALDFLAGRRVEFELARDATGRCPRGFGLIGMPSAYLIDASGQVRAVTRGFRPGEARALRSQIERLLADSPSTLPAVAAGRAVERVSAAEPIESAPR